MGEALKPFERNGEKEELIDISADEILCAIAKGRKVVKIWRRSP